MAEFDYRDHNARMLRQYQTHALTAQMFADASTSAGNAEAWRNIARSWTELAKLREQMAESEAQAARFATEIEARRKTKLTDGQ